MKKNIQHITSRYTGGSHKNGIPTNGDSTGGGGSVKGGSPTDDEILRQIIGSSNIKAPANLKYRIMQQVTTEEALKASKKKAHKPNTTLSDTKSVFITMYAVLGMLGAGVYFIRGKEYLLSTEFMKTAILITLIFSLIWLAISADAYLKEKRNRKEKG